MVVVDKFAQRRSDFEDANTTLIFIGHGGDKKANEYDQTLHLQGKLYLDQKRQSHAILQLKDAGWFGLLDSKGMTLSKEASAKGFKIGWKGVGSITQLGGVAIINPDKGITYVHRCQKPYDYPEVDDVIAQCKGTKE